MCGSTCFGRLSVHYQDRTTVVEASGFILGAWRLKRGCWSVVGRGLADHDQQRSNGKTRGSKCSCTLLMMDGEAPDWLNSLNCMTMHGLTNVKCRNTTIQHYTYYIPSFLGTFANFRKVTTSFFMSVRPSARTEELGVHWTDFHKI